MKKITLSTAITAALGISGLVVSPTVSAIVADGNYAMVINNTPLTPGTTNPQIGSDGNWNSSFTFGCLPGVKGCVSQYMYDNGATHNSRGSSIGGDGVAGVLNISVASNAFTVSSFNVDAIFNTGGGTFVQYTNTGTGGMSGSISGTSMSFDPTGRLGAITAPQALDRAWNIDNCAYTANSGCTDNGNTAWSIFTTGTMSASPGSITGTPLVNVGDINGDGLDDYTATLVSAGFMGTAWTAFYGAPYYEVWNVTLLSQVPVPAAAWLFGSGLLGLVGVARRRMAS